jgi:hypothetical protein
VTVSRVHTRTTAICDDACPPRHCFFPFSIIEHFKCMGCVYIVFNSLQQILTVLEVGNEHNFQLISISVNYMTGAQQKIFGILFFSGRNSFNLNFRSDN